MSLSTYHKKRNFKDTPEPKSNTATRRKQPIFVVQRHDASRLHYDFRLEAGRTLKSWAVPKGPSMHPGDKRLAVHVEDHPTSYATFEGDIPEGNYGAGHVDVWDHGTYEPVDENGDKITAKAFLEKLEEGHIKFRLKGKKLNGRFVLVQMKGRGDKNWLLIKEHDEHAVDKPYDAEKHGAVKAVKKKPGSERKK